MYEEDIEILMEQVRNILLNKPEIIAPKTQAQELEILQEAITYLSTCLAQTNEFLKNLSMGHLDTPAPSRHNFLASNLKELHSGLRHLTWQANQVANGDYSQKVSFWGEFSDSFNRMKDQLEERENKLKRQAAALHNSVDLMVAIMDGLSDWVIVTQKRTGDILYKNRSAKDGLLSAVADNPTCGKDKCPLTQRISNKVNDDSATPFEFECPITGRVLCVETFFIQWNEKMAYVHFISDITDESGEKKVLETMAFRDELTGFYNRRYCLKVLNDLLAEKKSFSACLFDIDGLKRVNDKYGHLTGDVYIKTVTGEMKKFYTTSDKMCRIGGDEFLVIAIGMSESLCHDRIRQLDENISAIKSEYYMGLSSGVVYVHGGSELTTEQILSKVDEQMYKSKEKKKQCRL